MRKYFFPTFILLSLWWLASLLVHRAFLPAPPAVFKEFIIQMRKGALAVHLGISLYRVTAALAGAFIPAFILGVSAGLNRKMDRIISPVVYLLFPIPKVALLPLMLLFMGLGNLSKIFLVSLIVFFQFYLNLRDESAGISRRYFDSLYTLGGSRTDLFRHVILPALMPRIFSSLRMTLGTSIAVLFMAETFATNQGIGWYIMDAWARVSYLQMYTGIAGLSLMGLLLFSIIDAVEKQICPWEKSREI